MKRIFYFLLIAYVCYASPACAQADVPSFVKDSLDTYVQRAMRDAEVPGIAVAIIKDGQVTVKTYGVKQLGKNDKVNENTLFMIGSNTKAITATALAMLEDQKKLSLDDKVVKWLPDFKLKDAWVTKELNIRDLLCHRIGMETFQGDFMYWTSSLTDKQVLEKFGQLTPVYGFRSRWGYTNAAFGAAGHVIKAASGKSWSDFITENIFRPLGMNNTIALSKGIQNASNIAVPHTRDHDQKLIAIPFCDIDNIAPAGSVSSSITDMSKWVQMLLNNGKVNGEQVISSNAILQTRVPHSIIGNGGHPYTKVNFSLYGLGWGLEDYNGRRMVSHTGGVNGFVTSVTLIPDEKLGVIVLTNTDQNALYEAIKYEIIDAYMKLPYRNYANIVLNSQKQQLNTAKEVWKKKSDTVAMHKPATLSLAAYAGVYEHEVYGTLTVKNFADHLMVTFQHHPKLQLRLDPLGGDRFAGTYDDPAFGKKVIPFVTQNGQAKSLTLRVADFVEFTTYEFIRK
jgi:CubicO group peptidase (beta-lactamase class C family)